MAIVFVRALILYAVVVIVMRTMGKRQIGQLQPFEFVVAIMMADLAAVPMQDIEIPLINGVIPIVSLLFAQLLISWVCLKSEAARGVVCGKPTIVIDKGKMVEQSMASLRYNINDLLEQLRSKNYPNIEDVEYGILETNGELSVIPKSFKRQVQTQDIGLMPEKEEIPVTVIIGGGLLRQNLEKAKVTEEWVKAQLNGNGLTVGEILYAHVSKNGLYYQEKIAQ